MVAGDVVTICASQVVKGATASLPANYRVNAHLPHSSLRGNMCVMMETAISAFRIHKTINIKHDFSSIPVGTDIYRANQI